MSRFPLLEVCVLLSVTGRQWVSNTRFSSLEVCGLLSVTGRQWVSIRGFPSNRGKPVRSLCVTFSDWETMGVPTAYTRFSLLEVLC